MEPLSEFARILGRELPVALVTRQLDDGFGTEAAVEMIVEKNLGERTDDALGQFHGKGGPFSNQNYEQERSKSTTY
jgi:hypothetical protein